MLLTSDNLDDSIITKLYKTNNGKGIFYGTQLQSNNSICPLDFKRAYRLKWADVGISPYKA